MGRRFCNGDELMGERLIRFMTWDLDNARRRRHGWDLEGWEVRDGRGLISGVDEIRMIVIG